MLSEVRCELSNGHPPSAEATFPLSLRIIPRTFLAQSRSEVLHEVRHLVLSFFDWPIYARRLNHTSAPSNTLVRSGQQRFYCLALANPPPMRSDFRWTLDDVPLVWEAKTVDAVSLEELLDEQIAQHVLKDVQNKSLFTIFSVFAPMISIAVFQQNLTLNGLVECEAATIIGKNSASLVQLLFVGRSSVLGLFI